MRKSRQSYAGRSMIEMIGVLAIVGILSVGGIVGFGKAMKTYKLTTATVEYAGFIRDLLEFRNSVLFKLMEYCPEEFICFMSKKIQIFFRMSAKISKILFMTILIFIEYTIKY